MLRVLLPDKKSRVSGRVVYQVRVHSIAVRSAEGFRIAVIKVISAVIIVHNHLPVSGARLHTIPPHENEAIPKAASAPRLWHRQGRLPLIAPRGWEGGGEGDSRIAPTGIFA